MNETETRDPAVEPTPEQWVDEFLALARADQETRALGVIQRARVATRCFVEAHPASLRSLRRSLDRVIDQRDELRRTLAAARAEVARLRQDVQVAADECSTVAAYLTAQSDRSTPRAAVMRKASTVAAGISERLRALLAPVVPSGEACVRGDGSVCVSDPDACVEAGVCWPGKPSGEAESGVDAVLRVAADAMSAPVSSGGQADGEGWYEFLKPVVSTTHIAYVHEDASLYLPESGVDEADFHVAQASGRCWRLLREADLAARPVLSREALRERIDPLVDGFIREWVPPVMQGHLLDDDGNAGERLREALADVLAGGQR